MATEQKRNVRPASDDDTYQIVEDAGRETVKRPSCKWKGQTDADEDSARSAGSPISRMPQSTKGGLRPTRHAISPKPTPATILNVLAEMKNNGKSDYSTHFVDKALNYINKHTDLNQPEQVKAFIANLQTTTGYKKNLCLAYNKYAKHYQIQWKMPLYIPEAKTIKIPTREKIQMLIAHASRTLSLKLTLSMETGLRPIELCNLKVKDIDLDQNRNNEPSIYQ